MNLSNKLDIRLDIFEINQIAIFKANRLSVLDLVILNDEKNFRNRNFVFVILQS